VVGPRELESLTSCVSSRRSNQLSYGPAFTANLQYTIPRSNVIQIAVLGAAASILSTSGGNWPGSPLPGQTSHSLP
jgi:hypothetical protein